MKIKISAIAVLAAMAVILMPSAYANAGELDIEGELGLWWVLYEGADNGIIQAGTEDPASDVASGFNLNRARLAFVYGEPDYRLSGKFQLKFEDDVDLMDCYILWNMDDSNDLYLGQFKIPSTYEVLLSNTDLDFITRSTLSSKIADWSLSKTIHYNTFYGNKSYNRDAGVGLKGAYRDCDGRDMFRYFLMIGNGIGHSLYIGARESKEFLFSNDFGDFLYAARFDWMPSDAFTIGGHYSINRHDNVLYQDEKTVFDLDRSSWSLDCRYDTDRYRLATMYGAGAIKDDFLNIGKHDLDYSGWEAKVMIPVSDDLELGARFDRYTTEYSENGNIAHQNNWTFGLNYMPYPDLRLQFDYIAKRTDNPIEPDPDDDIMFLNIQYYFDSGDLFDNDSEDTVIDSVTDENETAEETEHAD